ncbi:VanZ family protein [Salinisphaera sp. LB1]|uniref:VanZ family protein n=1 Tax=Salinisphaera sp. LB1 TaxID=2183911 RepID=UPI000D7E512F|nr:VanZ family protein [Salinisphaera sp. LB1]AWN16684.1 VanZ family protein [Salinisphaera sp. LB1]
MPSLNSPRRFVYASLAATIFIVYGSLYPFAFHGGSPVAAVRTLFLSDHMRDQPFSGLIANIGLYVPLSLFCVAAQNDARPAWRQVLWATGLGTVLCVGIEISQFFDTGRVTTLTDVYANVAGTLFGALLALPLTRWLDRPGDMNSPARQTAALLLLSFLACRLFPYVPTIDLHAYWRAIKPVVIHPSVHGFDVVSYAVTWTVVAALLRDLAGRRRSRWLLVAVMLAMLSAKILITHNRLSLSELVALPVAVAAWLVLSTRQRAWAGGVLAVLLGLVIVGDRLLPFDWQPIGHAFGWLPFFSILHGSMAANTQALADKVFLYSSLVWLITVAGPRHAVAGALVAAGLFATSVLETHLPGRSAEITDAVIALGAATVLGWLAVSPGTGQTAAGARIKPVRDTPPAAE